MEDHPEAALHFEDVCDGLDLDADFLRGALKRWRVSEIAGMATERRQRGDAAEPGQVTRLETARRQRVFTPPRSWARRWR